ncbi:hypothetical protein GIB67_042305, partial [Kingdonia uniflora]
NGRGLDLHRFGLFVDDDDDVPQSNVYLLNEHVLTNVLHLSIHISNEPLLTNVSPSNEPMLTNVPLSIEPKPIIGQTETSVEFRFEPQPEQVKDFLDFRFKSAAYTEVSCDFSKEFNIGDLYRDRIKLKNHIRAYAVENKFNLKHVLSNEYKIVHFTSMVCHFFRYRVTYKNHVESWNNIILKVRDLSMCLLRNYVESIRKCPTRIPCKHGVRALGLANVDPTTSISEYFTNNTYKQVLLYSLSNLVYLLYEEDGDPRRQAYEARVLAKMIKGRNGGGGGRGYGGVDGGGGRGDRPPPPPPSV